jgi:hypothetical protein
MSEVIDTTEETPSTEGAVAVDPTDAPSPASTFDVVATPAIYRNYTRPTKDGKNELAVLKQSKDGSNFAEKEKEGFTSVAENTYTTYEVTSLTGFADLVPSDEQKLYVINVGLRNIQSSKIAATQKEWDKESSSFVNNGQTIDMREYINEPPGRKSLSAPVKLMQGVTELATTDRQAALDLVAALMKQLGME